MAYKWGDIVWARLPFTSYQDDERHPVIIVSQRNRGREVTVIQMTSKVGRARARGDYVLKRPHDHPANLDKAGAVRPKIFIILKGRVLERIGHLHQDDYDGVKAFIRSTLGCD